MIQYILIVVSVLLVAGTKFMLAPALALTYKLSYFESLLYTIIGAILGLFLYAYLFSALIRVWGKIKKWFRGDKPEKQPKKISRKRLRKLIYIKNKWGLWGIAALMPLLSLPVSTFLAIRFFPRSRPLFVLMAAVVVWALVLNSAYFFLGKAFV